MASRAMSVRDIYDIRGGVMSQVRELAWSTLWGLNSCESSYHRSCLPRGRRKLPGGIRGSADVAQAAERGECLLEIRPSAQRRILRISANGFVFLQGRLDCLWVCGLVRRGQIRRQC